MSCRADRIQDLHSHTRYSDCGRDEPRAMIEAAIAGGITDFGITDHNYGIGDDLSEYCDELTLLREEYKDRISLYLGIEISTYPHQLPGEGCELGRLDYCLMEHLQNDLCLVEDIVEFTKEIPIPCGIAHTDMFDYCLKRGLEPLAFFKRLGENGIFWEMNVNYDSIHGWREHSYVLEFMNNKEQQEIIKNSGICLSVGFDGHRLEDYDPQRVKQMNDFLRELEIPIFQLK